MKKRFLFLAFYFIFIIPIFCSASPADGLYWCDLQDDAGDSVNVLDVPSFERGDIVGTLVQHERYYEHTYVKNYKGELWCRIRLNSEKNYTEGYIPASVVRRQQCPDGPGPRLVEVRWKYGNGTINFDGTKLRKAPNSDSDILEVMNTDDQCFVLARVLVGDNTWYRVMRNRTIGYISGTFLDVKPDVWGHLR